MYRGSEPAKITSRLTTILMLRARGCNEYQRFDTVRMSQNGRHDSQCQQPDLPFPSTFATYPTPRQTKITFVPLRCTIRSPHQRRG